MASELLADLAREYEKSQALLEQIEDSLKDRMCCPAPDDASVNPLPECKGQEDEEQGEADSSELPSNNGPPSTPGLRAKFAKFFSRNRPMSVRDQANPEGEDLEVPKRRISVVTLAGPVDSASDCPRRSVSFLPSGSHAALKPTSALHRPAPRASLEVRQHQLFLQDSMDPGRLSSANLGAFPAAPLHRKSMEPVVRRTSLEAGSNIKSRVSQQQQFLIDATVAAACSHSQLQQPSGLPTGSSPALLHTLSSKHHLDVSPPTPPPLLGREDSIVRRRSLCRRGSDNATGLSRAISFTHQQQQQHHHHQPPPLQLNSPVGASPSGCLSPITSVAATGLPTPFHSATSSRSLMGNSSSRNNLSSPGPMRAHSMSAMAPAGPGAAAGDADGAVYDRGPLTTSAGERCSVSATGFLCPPAAAAAACGPASPGGGGGGGRLSQAQLPQLPQRARSVHLIPSSRMGSDGGSPKGGEPRRLQASRCRNQETGSSDMFWAGQEESDRRLHSLGHYAASGGGGGGKEAGGAGSFRGTMHLI